MAFNSIVIPVMIASPGDVSQARSIIRSTINEWNDINALRSKFVLMPVGWETHSSPELGERPQELINSQVLKDCDLLVAVFWSRLGTPTGVAASGTVEEIQEHVAAGKPAMVYFCTSPIAQEQLDDEEFKKQWAELKIFKKWCSENGLIENFDAMTDFSEKFRRQLQIKITTNPYLISLMAESGELGTVGSDDRLRTRRISLSSEAAELLIAVANDRHGTVMSMRYMGGQSIEVGGHNFIQGNDRRTIAKWEAALNELIDEALIKDIGYKGEIFEITALGYEVVDKLKES